MTLPDDFEVCPTGSRNVLQEYDDLREFVKFRLGCNDEELARYVELHRERGSDYTQQEKS